MSKPRKEQTQPAQVELDASDEIDATEKKDTLGSRMTPVTRVLVSIIVVMGCFMLYQNAVYHWHLNQQSVAIICTVLGVYLVGSILDVSVYKMFESKKAKRAQAKLQRRRLKVNRSAAEFTITPALAAPAAQVTTTVQEVDDEPDYAEPVEYIDDSQMDLPGIEKIKGEIIDAIPLV